MQYQLIGDYTQNYSVFSAPCKKIYSCESRLELFSTSPSPVLSAVKGFISVSKISISFGSDEQLEAASTGSVWDFFSKFPAPRPEESPDEDPPRFLSDNMAMLASKERFLLLLRWGGLGLGSA